MGTTMTVALVEGKSVAIGHVGDSRAYLVRDGRLEQLTEDHSLVNELLKSGKLSPEEAETHPQRSVITRAVGTDPDVDVDSFTIDTQDGDIFVICSDGLTDMVDDHDILDMIEDNLRDLDRAARELVSAANRGGGEDNITVVAFEIVPDGGGDVEETVRLPVAGADVDEDTLDGQHSVPRVDTMVVPPDHVEEFTVSGDGAATVDYDGRDRLQRRARLQLVLTILLLLAVAAGLILWELLR
jgi:protein phosphatase